MGALFWAILTVIFTGLEVVIPGLVTIWLALSALVVTLFANLINNSKIEFLIFSILSLIFVLFTRPIVQKYMKKKENKFNSKMVGSEVKIEKIVNINENKKVYEVKFKGSIWTGISEEEYNLGDIVKIKKFEGNKIVLKK